MPKKVERPLCCVHLIASPKCLLGKNFFHSAHISSLSAIYWHEYWVFGVMLCRFVMDCSSAIDAKFFLRSFFFRCTKVTFISEKHKLIRCNCRQPQIIVIDGTTELRLILNEQSEFAQKSSVNVTITRSPLIFGLHPLLSFHFHLSFLRWKEFNF